MTDRNHTHTARACLLLVLSSRSSAELAEHLGVTTHYVGRIMRRLASHGIVERDPNAKTASGHPFIRQAPWKLTEDYMPDDIRRAMQLGAKAIREEGTTCSD